MAIGRPDPWDAAMSASNKAAGTLAMAAANKSAATLAPENTHTWELVWIAERKAIWADFTTEFRRLCRLEGEYSSLPA
jgi:hypothetical protein